MCFAALCEDADKYISPQIYQMIDQRMKHVG
jgi:hypothetical protein